MEHSRKLYSINGKHKPVKFLAEQLKRRLANTVSSFGGWKPLGKFLDLQESSVDFSVPGLTKLTPFKMGATEQTIFFIVRLFCMLASASWNSVIMKLIGMVFSFVIRCICIEIMASLEATKYNERNDQQGW